jgi:uncharacterized protein (DUF488 family)
MPVGKAEFITLNMKSIIYTIGTGLRSSEDFMEILFAYEISEVLDVRSYPVSKLEHFSKERFAELLQENGIDYCFLGIELGGRRKGGYASYLDTDEFRAGLLQLEGTAEGRTAAIVCAERFPWKCHRKWISLELHKRGWEVRHIIDKGKVWIPK